MAKFVYRMQSILDIKNKLEEQAKMEFAAAKVQLDLEEEKLEIIRQRKLDYEEEGRRLRRDSLHVRDIIDNRNAITQMDEYRIHQEKCVAKAAEVLEMAREHMKEARQERKTHEKLREKAFDEFVHEENAKEAKEVDELTSYTYGQKRGE